MQVPAELLVELQKATDGESGHKKWNCQPGRIACEQKHALPNRFACRRHSQHGRKNRTNAGRPAESKGKAHQEATERTRLPTQLAEMDVAIEPPRQNWSDKE